MEETVQALFDEGALKRSEGSVELIKPLASLRIPPTVQTILAARIDRLRNDEKKLLQTLAVLGRAIRPQPRQGRRRTLGR